MNETSHHSGISTVHGEDRQLSSCDKSDSNSRDDLEVLLPTTTDASLRIKAAIEQIQVKIVKTKEAIKAEQTLRDTNVDEYLKLAANADEVQVQRIKSIFEKKNKQSAQAIAILQKKLDKYSIKLKEIEKCGVNALYQPGGPRAVLSNVVHGLKEVGRGISGLSEGVMGSIKPFQSSTPSSGDNTGHSIKESPGGNVKMDTTLDDSSRESLNPGDGEADDRQNEKHGSYTQYTQGSSLFYVHSHSHSTKPTSDENSSITSDENMQSPRPPLNEGSSASQNESRFVKRDRNRVTSHTGSSNNIIESELMANLRERENEFQRLSEEIKTFKTQYHEEFSVINQALQEERYKSERLEEQMNDLIELHQNEIENLKQNIYDIEEKILYQSEERLRDIHEMLESCQTRISRIEHQQHQQQFVNLNSIEDSKTKAFALKFINVVLTILQVILLLVATIVNVVTPLTKTRICVLGLLLLVFSIMMRNSEERSELLEWANRHFTRFFPGLAELLPKYLAPSE